MYEGRPVPQFLFTSEKNCRMIENVVLYLLKYAHFKIYFVYRTLNTNKNKVHELPA
jgi:hypothetical protein